jgi:hypothetical protein
LGQQAAGQVLLLLLTLPLLWLGDPAANPLRWLLTYLGIVSVGPPLLYAVSQWELYRGQGWLRRLAVLPLLVGRAQRKLRCSVGWAAGRGTAVSWATAAMGSMESSSATTAIITRTCLRCMLRHSLRSSSYRAATTARPASHLREHDRLETRSALLLVLLPPITDYHSKKTQTPHKPWGRAHRCGWQMPDHSVVSVVAEKNDPQPCLDT